MIKKVYDFFLRILRLKLCCDISLPMRFLRHGCVIPHPHGITISVRTMGSECHIYQNVTIGGNSKKWGTVAKPSIGDNVVVFAGAIISGNVVIGSNVVITANSVVTRNVPDNSVVYGANRIEPLTEVHKEIIAYHKHHCRNVYHLTPGLRYKA